MITWAVAWLHRDAEAYIPAILILAMAADVAIAYFITEIFK